MLPQYHLLVRAEVWWLKSNSPRLGDCHDKELRIDRFPEDRSEEGPWLGNKDCEFPTWLNVQGGWLLPLSQKTEQIKTPG